MAASWPRSAFRSGVQAQTPAPSKVLFTNVRLFDGKSPTLRDGLHLLVDGNRIQSIGAGTPAAPDGAQTIDARGRVLMPGLIDAHWHSLFAALPLPVLLQGNIGYIHMAAAAEAQRTLMRASRPCAISAARPSPSSRRSTKG